MSKIACYIGFAVKSSKIIYGIDNIEKARKKMYALVISENASANLRDQAERFSERKKTPLLTVSESLEELVHKNNCKIIALTDANMAKAVIENAGR